MIPKLMSTRNNVSSTGALSCTAICKAVAGVASHLFHARQRAPAEVRKFEQRQLLKAGGQRPQEQQMPVQNQKQNQRGLELQLSEQRNVGLELGGEETWPGSYRGRNPWLRPPSECSER